MPARTRKFDYVYESDARESRTGEYTFVKYFLAVMIMLYLFSSIYIYFFIFQQADWERNRWQEDARAWAGVTTWAWCTAISVIVSDIVAIAFFYFGIVRENATALIAFSGLSLVYSIYGIVSVYLRGSIVCFVIPFTCGVIGILMFFMLRNEEEMHKLSRGLTLKERDCRRYDSQELDDE